MMEHQLSVYQKVIQKVYPPQFQLVLWNHPGLWMVKMKLKGSDMNHEMKGFDYVLIKTYLSSHETNSIGTEYFSLFSTLLIYL